MKGNRYEAYDYRAGDVLTGVMEETENPIEFHILKKTTEQPMGLNIQGIGVLVVSSEWLQDRTEGFIDDLTVYNVEAPYQVPWLGIMIAVGAVFILLFSIMRYSMGKINRKNIIETIQNENI